MESWYLGSSAIEGRSAIESAEEVPPRLFVGVLCNDGCEGTLDTESQGEGERERHSRCHGCSCKHDVDMASQASLTH
jgi:hypothetical protein